MSNNLCEKKYFKTYEYSAEKDISLTEKILPSLHHMIARQSTRNSSQQPIGLKDIETNGRESHRNISPLGN